MADFSDSETQKPQSTTLDFKRVLYRALKYWYLVLLSVVVALTGAFLYNRYSIPVYEVNASIIIRETQEPSEGKLLYNNPIVSPYRNYYNELYILRSLPLLERVIDSLNFNVLFFREGKVLTVDAYHHSPIDARVLGKSDNGTYTFRLVIENQQQFKLETDEEKIYRFGDTVQHGNLKFVVYRKEDKDLGQYLGDPFILQIMNRTQAARSYAARLEAKWAEQGASVVNLRIQGHNQYRAADFMKELIAAYQHSDLEKKNLTASRAIQFIGRQLASIRDSLRFFEVQLENFKNNNIITDMNAEAMRIFQKLEAYEAQKAALLVNRNYYQYLRDYLRKDTGSGQVILPSAMGIQDGVLMGLVNTMVGLQQEILQFTGPDRARNPLVEERRARLAIIKKDILESINTLEATDGIRLEQINQQIRDTEKQLSHLPAAERQYITLQRSYTLLENLYVYLMQKKAEAEISRESSVSDILVVNYPQVSGPISPKKLQNYAIAAAAGLVIPLALFIVFELFNTRVQSKEDIEKVTNIPFIGGVGHNNLQGNLVVNQRPKSAVAESFRALRYNIGYFTGYEDKKIILITSSISGEGKTFTTINLATVLAMSGKKNADYRSRYAQTPSVLRF